MFSSDMDVSISDKGELERFYARFYNPISAAEALRMKLITTDAH